MRQSSPVSAQDQPASKRYRLLYKIATGGSGTVYVGQRLGALDFSRLVAIKRANPELAGDPEAREALVREARVASRIHSAHVVAVVDVEVVSDEVLLVMDYVPGGTLADLLERGALPPRLAVRIALDACSGLRAVHELCDDAGVPLGALHRDVSPDNVLVGLDGSVRITDFGLARLAHTSYATATSLVSGKLAYVAPEVLEGKGFGAQSDLFALGVVVWETLGGKRLFGGGDEKETSQKVRTMPAPPISAVARGIPAELDEVLGRALEKSPRARWESVGAFADALEAVVRRGELVATDGELGAHVRAVVGDDKRSSLSRARVSAAGGRPALDFSFAETASLVLASTEPLDDAPTASLVDKKSAAPAAWPIEARDEPAGSPVVAEEPVLVVRSRWRGAAIAAAVVGAVAVGAVVAWGDRSREHVGAAEAIVTSGAPTPRGAEPIAADSVGRAGEPAAPSAEPSASSVERAPPRVAPSRDTALPKERPTDPTALPSNPYRKKL